MKVVKMRGLKPEVVDLDYAVLQEELERYQKKGKEEYVSAFSKLLGNLNTNSTSEEIEAAVNNVIAANTAQQKELEAQIKATKKQIVALEKEIAVLSDFSEKATNEDVLPLLIMNLLN